MTQAVETLLFDFGGTLDADGVAWKERFYALYRAEGLNIAADAFAAAFHAADDALIGAMPPSTGLVETVRLLAANVETELARRLPESGSGETGMRRLDGARGGRVGERFLAEMYAAFARNRPVLAALGEHYKLGIVSNFYGNLEAVCRSSGLAPLFAVMTDSHCVGAEKPDPAIFHAALETLRAAPATTVFVGDSLHRDLEGARRTGMRFIWIAPQDVQAAEARKVGTASIFAAVSELREVANILK